MRTADRRTPGYEILVFILVTFPATWLLWLPALLISNHGISFPGSRDLFITLGTFVPSAAGLFLAFLFGGTAGLNSLLRSLVQVRIRGRWLLFAVLVLPGVSAVAALIYVLLGEELPPLQFAPWVLPLVFLYILLLMGPLGEEAGWRGFALKRMLLRMSPATAAVRIGLIWSLWHLPLFFIEGTTQNLLTGFGVVPAVAGYLLYTCLLSVLLTLLYIHSGGSVFGAVLMHSMANLSLGVVPIVFTLTGAVLLLIVLSLTTLAFSIRFRAGLLRGPAAVSQRPPQE